MTLQHLQAYDRIKVTESEVGAMDRNADGLRLALNAPAHLLVDGLCAATVFGPVRAAGDPAVLILVYNTLAFSTQCLVGLAADRIRQHETSEALAMALIVLGFALPLPAWLRVEIGRAHV